MKLSSAHAIAALVVGAALAAPGSLLAQPAAAPATAAAAPLPADPWPRTVDLTNGQVLVYQPQVSKWDGNRIDFEFRRFDDSPGAVYPTRISYTRHATQPTPGEHGVAEFTKSGIEGEDGLRCLAHGV
jgi:hypothetical protein